MKDWIKKNIDSPGMEKKNRGSLFSLIGRVFDVVKKDAVKAFNAFFPFLADPKKLREHGASLSIPEFPYDTEDGYCERVSTASFFLMKAGERGYIMDQLRGHFGDQFVLKEDFLRLFINIAELSKADRIWIHSLLDELLDPNIQLTVSEWFHFVDAMPMSEELFVRVRRSDRDSFAGRFFCNGQFYCDQGRKILCDGSWLCDGSVNAARFMPARGTVSDFILRGVYADGSWICDGSVDCSGHTRIFSPDDNPDPVLPASDFTEGFDTRLAIEPFEDTARIHAICDGSYTGFDGLFYSGDQIYEEVLR